MDSCTSSAVFDALSAEQSTPDFRRSRLALMGLSGRLLRNDPLIWKIYRTDQILAVVRVSSIPQPCHTLNVI
jgi:hypothetical protein